MTRAHLPAAGAGLGRSNRSPVTGLSVNFLDDGSRGPAGVAVARVLKALRQALQQQVHVMRANTTGVLQLVRMMSMMGATRLSADLPLLRRPDHDM